jgi:hypothetical protein
MDPSFAESLGRRLNIRKLARSFDAPLEPSSPWR